MERNRPDLDDDCCFATKAFKDEKFTKKLTFYYVVEKIKNKNPSIRKMLFKCFWRKYCRIILWILLHKGVFLFAFPLAMKEFLGFFKSTAEFTYDSVLKQSLTFSMIFFGKTIIETHKDIYHNRVMLKMKIALRSLMYDVLLISNVSKLHEKNKKELLMLFNKDLIVLDKYITSISDLIGGIFHIFLAYFYIYQVDHDYPLYVIYGVITSVIVTQGLGGWLMYLFKRRSNPYADKRSQITHEIFTNIRFIKRDNLEGYFSSKVMEICEKEVKSKWYDYIFLISNELFAFTASPGSFFISLHVYVLSGHKLSADVVYYLLCFYLTFSFNLHQKVAEGLENVSLFRKVTDRMNAFLFEVDNVQTRNPHISSAMPKVALQNVAASWGDQIVLRDISFKAEKGINLVVGSPGCGKSVLVKILLGEHSNERGNVTLEGSVSYASQHPWLFPFSIRQNVLCGQPMNIARYMLILTLTEMTPDISLLQEKDETIVKDNGANLAPSLRAKINLARALYRNSDIYILDDCISSVEPSSKKSIFKKSIKDFLRSKICIYLTNDTSLTEYADFVIVMKNGQISTCGPPSEIPTSEFDSDPVIAGDGEVETTECEGDEETEILEKIDKPVAASNQKEFRKLGRLLKNLMTRYLKSCGPIYLGLFTVTVALFYGGSIFAHLTLREWIDFEEKVPEGDDENRAMKINKWIFLYFVTVITIYVFYLLGLLFLYPFMVNFIAKSQQLILRNLIECKMKYFNNHTVNALLNNISQDFKYIDQQLAFTIFRCIRVAVAATANVILIMFVDPLTNLASLSFVCALYLIGRFYLGTARSLQRLEHRCANRMVNHLNNTLYLKSTLDGLTTIRAYGMQYMLNEEFAKCQKLLSNASETAKLSTTNVFFVMSLTSAVFLSAVLSRCNTLIPDISAATAGLLTIQGMELCFLIEYLTKIWLESDEESTSIERILEYTELEKELKTGCVDSNWPVAGAITFSNVGFSHKDSKVFSGITFAVNGGEKIAIFGGPRGGRTTLVSLLMKLDDFSGEILVDDVNIDNVPLDQLRNSIAFVPQHPVCFCGSVRENLDPLLQHNDTELWNVLSAVRLNDVIANLDENLSTFAFSLNQKKLLTLSRALLKNPKIVIIDNLFSKKDFELGEIMKGAFESFLKYKTVISITDDFDNISGYDRVMILDKGQIVYYDNSANLLSNGEMLSKLSR